MNLSATEQKFVQRRRQLQAHWRYVGIGTIAACLGLAAWLLITTPLMINPYYVMQRVEAGSLSESTMIVSAVMLPLVTVALIGLMFVLIAGMYACFANERKYIAMIDNLSSTERPRGNRS